MANIKDQEEKLVDLNTSHEVIIFEKKSLKILSQVLVILVKLFFLAIGFYIGYQILYKECLFSKECNTIVVGYLSVVSLACFMNVGLPVEKLANSSVLKSN